MNELCLMLLENVPNIVLHKNFRGRSLFAAFSSAKSSERHVNVVPSACW
jgi:hypothetical protein